MSGLREAVLQYVATAKQNPVSAGDPTLLDALSQSALDDCTEGYATLTAPVSPYTWEVRATLLGTAVDTGRVTFEFPWAVDIAGMRPAVVAILPVGGGLVTPGLDNIDVAIDINKENTITTAQGQSTVGGQGGNSFVSLGSVSVQTPRVLNLRLGTAQPVIGFQFRWSQPPVAGTAVFADVLIKLSMFAYKYKPESSANVHNSLRGSR